MIAIVRMRGEIGTRREMIDTFKMLGLKKVYSVVTIKDTPDNLGMLRKVENLVTWGEASAETVELLKGKRNLKPPRGGFKSKKLKYPQGNLGYCGTAINDLIKKMV